jgi:hypothetical protein
MVFSRFHIQALKAAGMEGASDTNSSVVRRISDRKSGQHGTAIHKVGIVYFTAD